MKQQSSLFFLSFVLVFFLIQLSSTVLIAAADSLSPVSQNAEASASIWWDSKWSYRVPITIEAAGYTRFDKPVDVAINFTGLLSELGVGGTVNLDSLYLNEVDGDGNLLSENVPFQYDPPSKSDSLGSLTILMTGVTAAKAKRFYHLYFDVEGAGSFTPQTVTPLVSVTDNVFDEGMKSYKIQTDKMTYYYHKEGGGFSSLIDIDNNDWISYSPEPESAGDFRGIPNLVFPTDGGYFHPGRTGVVSSIIAQGPLKALIYSHTADKAWETLWEIYPAYARLTVLKVATNYWFLYEGTPGGILEVESDFIVRSDDTETLANVSWTGDLSPEWLYFSDPVVDRSLFFAHHEDDEMVDSYHPMKSDMTVFGFGRDGVSRYLSQVPSYFTFGFEEGVEIGVIRKAVNSAYKDVSVAVGSPEVNFPYTLEVNKQGNGRVTVDPDKAEYSYGEEVMLEAIADPGWTFKEWAGDLTGQDQKAVVTIMGDMEITAVFIQNEYTLTIDKIGLGSVSKLPDKAFYFYGEVVKIEATPAKGWIFSGWGGDISGDEEKVSLTITDNHTVYAQFSEPKYYIPAILSQ